MKILIDTNVILDVYLNREPFAADSAQVLKLSESGQAAGSITANTVTDIYYILGRQIKDRDRLKELLSKLFQIVTVTDVLGPDVRKALELPVDDYEDAVIVQCAIRTKSDYIITRNEDDFVNSSVPVLSPSAFLTQFFSE